MVSQGHNTTELGAVDVYAPLAAEILRRHNQGDSEADIRSAVRDFIIQSGLVTASEVTQEESPTEAAAGRVDLVARDAFFEFKRNLYSGAQIAPEHVRQLDDYLTDALTAGRGIRVGVLTDGRRWLLRRVGDGQVDAVSPPMWTLETEAGGLRLYEWLHDRVFEERAGNVAPTQDNLVREFGDASHHTNQDFATLRILYEREGQRETVQVKRRLWEDLLRAALGEIASAPADLDDLFIRHTYLSAVIGMAVQAAFGIDIRDVSAQEPADLLLGRRLRNATGLSGILESDFFAWPTEVAGGAQFIRQMADRVARFDWHDPPADIAPTLYEIVIPADERRQLGEYYTPKWLADAMTSELVDDPLTQRVLDPACGSGTFIVAAVERFMAAARESNLEPQEILTRLRAAVTGIDVHPAAVHLARASWALAARDAISAAADYNTEISAPIYLGDALQLRYRTGDLFAEHTVTIETRESDLGNPTLTFPMSLVERAGTFDALMSDIADAIERDNDPTLALDDNHVTDPSERSMTEAAIATMQMLHREGKNHIWAYYTRNMVRPVVLSRNKVDLIISNPPWINYNQTANILRHELETQSKQTYGIWAGGNYATHQDVAGLFYARAVDLYLKDGGLIGMVMPHSALQSGHYAKWRTGKWEQHGLTPKGNLSKRVERTLAVNFDCKSAWDLEQLEPNDFFPIASCVVFAERKGENAEATPLAETVELWVGKTNSDDVRRVAAGITDTSVAGESPYAGCARNGATIFPRCLFFVQETGSTTTVQAGQTITVNPRRGSQDKPPWKDLPLPGITGQPIERSHVYDVHLGETVVPYATLEPLKAVLPLKRGDSDVPADDHGPGGVRLGGLERRMRERWRTVSRLWEDNKSIGSKLSLMGNLDYQRKLSSQLDWQQDNGGRPLRVIYTKAGQPTAAILHDDEAFVENVLFWVPCKDMQEAYYLLAIINSDTLYDAVTPLMNKGQFGARDLHKHLWKLPIPEFDAGNVLHASLAIAGERVAAGAAERLAELRAERGDRLTVTIARRELREWLRSSLDWAVIELLMHRLIGNPPQDGRVWAENWEGRPGGRLVLSAAASLEEARLEREVAWEPWFRAAIRR
ncbi:MAG: N-6 DNA methylase [Chloroflexota bacterium]|nr:N-6 DNA methylase [Chloroflexota bacterium]MDE2960050.1 N-6 DNA methylase [Chloroflexota bacterium]